MAAELGVSGEQAVPFEQLNERFHALLIQYPERCYINMKYGYTAGVFGGGHHKEMEQKLLYLNPFENYVVRVIKSLIHTVDRPVLMLDEGAILGESMIVVGYALRDYVHSGQLELNASNYEKHYILDSMLAEAERRIHFLPIYEEIKSAKQKDDLNYDILGTMEATMKPIVTTQAEIDFIRKWSNLVDYHEGVDVLRLDQSYMPVVANGGFHLIHDHNAGLSWSEDQGKAVKSMLLCLNMDYGAIMTNVLPQEFEWPMNMMQAKLSGSEMGIKSPYDVISRPLSPARVLTLSDEMLFFEL